MQSGSIAFVQNLQYVI
uniref:Uncharacterized protein n=1 Tax=Moniliophthora roreri TaxID=221103 RepID=A0A0W0GFL1_MONRR